MRSSPATHDSPAARSRGWARVLAIGMGLVVVGIVGWKWNPLGSSSPASSTTARTTLRQRAARKPVGHHHVATQPTKKPSAPVWTAPASYDMSVPAQSQLPQLQNGCEVTSLSMLLAAVNHPVSKMTLAAEQPTDPTPAVLKPIPDFKGNPILEVVSWGNPNVGFVGSVEGGSKLGYGIYNGPLDHLLNQILPNQADDMTGDSFTQILDHVAHGVPVVAWTTINFLPTNDWVTWQSPEGPVTATPMEHAVLIVGYTPTTVIVNNPYTGQANEAVNRADFIAAWKQLGEQALTVHLPAGTAGSAS